MAVEQSLGSGSRDWSRDDRIGYNDSRIVNRCDGTGPSRHLTGQTPS